MRAGLRARGVGEGRIRALKIVKCGVERGIMSNIHVSFFLSNGDPRQSRKMASIVNL